MCVCEKYFRFFIYVYFKTYFIHTFKDYDNAKLIIYIYIYIYVCVCVCVCVSACEYLTTPPQEQNATQDQVFRGI